MPKYHLSVSIKAGFCNIATAEGQAILLSDLTPSARTQNSRNSFSLWIENNAMYIDLVKDDGQPGNHCEMALAWGLGFAGSGNLYSNLTDPHLGLQ